MNKKSGIPKNRWFLKNVNKMGQKPFLKNYISCVVTAILNYVMQRLHNKCWLCTEMYISKLKSFFFCFKKRKKQSLVEFSFVGDRVGGHLEFRGEARGGKLVI